MTVSDDPICVLDLAVALVKLKDTRSVAPCDLSSDENNACLLIMEIKKLIFLRPRASQLFISVHKQLRETEHRGH